VSAASNRRADRLGRAVRNGSIWLVLLVLLGISATLSDAFLSPVYLGNVVRQAAPIGIAAVGVTFVMILGMVDLSVGAIISFAAVFCAVQMDGRPGNVAAALLLTLAVGAGLGAINGVIVAFSRASPFILTLGSALAFYGLTQIYSGGTARGAIAPGFREFFNFRLAETLPVLALCFVAAALLAMLALALTRFGRSLYLIGSNPLAAEISGLSLAGTTLAAYMLSGLLAAAGGIALLARSGVSSTFAGRGLEFDVLAAVVLGGTTFEGGRGGVAGTVAGVLVLFIAFNVVNIVGLNYNFQLVVKGLIIIAASAGYMRLNQAG
jgi:ribose transport system permease protein